jgi:hypothetical protein
MEIARFHSTATHSIPISSKSARPRDGGAGAAPSQCPSGSARSYGRSRARTEPGGSAGPKQPCARPPGGRRRRSRTTRSTCARAGYLCAQRPSALRARAPPAHPSRHCEETPIAAPTLPREVYLGAVPGCASSLGQRHSGTEVGPRAACFPITPYSAKASGFTELFLTLDRSRRMGENTAAGVSHSGAGSGGWDPKFRYARSTLGMP